jgi:hypothetical protein
MGRILYRYKDVIRFIEQHDMTRLKRVRSLHPVYCFRKKDGKCKKGTRVTVPNPHNKKITLTFIEKEIIPPLYKALNKMEYTSEYGYTSVEDIYEDFVKGINPRKKKAGIKQIQKQFGREKKYKIKRRSLDGRRGKLLGE